MKRSALLLSFLLTTFSVYACGRFHEGEPIVGVEPTVTGLAVLGILVGCSGVVLVLAYLLGMTSMYRH